MMVEVMVEDVEVINEVLALSGQCMMPDGLKIDPSLPKRLLYLE